MNGSKSQSKYYSTACLMDEALIALLEKKSYEFITVKEICEKAGVNRSTFYLHYETMEDLLSECIEYVGRKIGEKYKAESVINKSLISTCPKEELLLFTPKYLLPYLDFIKENQKVHLAAVLQPKAMKSNEIANHLRTELFYPILVRFGIPRDEIEYRMTFYLNGVSAVITEWIKRGCKEPTEKNCKSTNGLLKHQLIFSC